MAKILISDLIGTLIPNNIMEVHNLYGKCREKDWSNICDDKEYHNYLMDKFPKQCINDLDNFLNDENILYIVTDLTCHDGNIKFILDRIIGSLHKYSNNNFNVFLVKYGGRCDFNLDFISNKITSKYTEEGVDYFIYDGYPIGIIPKKKDIFNIILNKYNIEENELLSIGNSRNDIPMLIKCMELGGKSSLLHYLLYSENNITLEKALSYKLDVEYYIKIEKEILDNFPNYSELNFNERKEIWNAYFYKGGFVNYVIQERRKYNNEMLQKLYEEINQGSLTQEFIIKQYLIFKIIVSGLETLEKKTLTENNWDQIDMYSTFRDYYNRVLSQDSKKNETNPQFIKVQKQSKED